MSCGDGSVYNHCCCNCTYKSGRDKDYQFELIRLGIPFRTREETIKLIKELYAGKCCSI